MVKFLRRTWNRYAKLGKGRKKKQVWRKPTGRDNKMREKKKGYPVTVSIGYGKNVKSRGLLEGKTPLEINNILDLNKINDNNIAVIGKIGKKKKMEIAEKAKEMKIDIYNMNPKSFLKKNRKKVTKKKVSESKNKEIKK